MFAPAKVVIFFFLLLQLQAQAADSPEKKTIEAEYQRSARSANIKYLDGFVSIRDPQYQGFGLDGKRIDCAAQLVQLARVFTTALSIKETVTVLSARSEGANQVVCQTHYITEVTQNSAKGPAATIIDTESSDLWNKTRKGWKLLRCRVRKQKIETPTKPPDE